MSVQREAEMALLGDIILESKKVLPEAELTLLPENFAVPELGRLFGCCCKLDKEGHAVDAVSLKAAAGSEYKDLIALAESTPCTTNFQEHIRIVREAAQKRRAQEAATELLTQLDHDAPLEECCEAAEKALACFNDRKMADATNAMQGWIQFDQLQRAQQEYIGTGMQQLDRRLMISGGDFVVVGGRPSAGKTALTLQWMLHMAKERECVYFSLETSTAKVFDRLIACYTGVPLEKIMKREIPDEGAESWESIADCQDSFMRLHLHVVQASGWTVQQIRAKALQLHAQVVFVDYIGLVHGSGKSLYEKATAVSGDLHVFAQELGMVVIALSQLNRAGSGMPSLENLRDSGAVEQDADAVLLLGFDEDGRGSAGISQRALLLAKNKTGRCGKISLSFDGARQQFFEVDNTREAES